jgi:hypothetical protein
MKKIYWKKSQIRMEPWTRWKYYTEFIPKVIWRCFQERWTVCAAYFWTETYGAEATNVAQSSHRYWYWKRWATKRESKCSVTVSKMSWIQTTFAKPSEFHLGFDAPIVSVTERTWEIQKNSG